MKENMSKIREKKKKLFYCEVDDVKTKRGNNDDEINFEE